MGELCADCPAWDRTQACRFTARLANDCSTDEVRKRMVYSAAGTSTLSLSQCSLAGPCPGASGEARLEGSPD